jgi:Activator of Hsp90 ATPase homolog 1-like protein
MIPDGRGGDREEILEIDPPRRLVLSWRNEFIPELRAEGSSRMSYELEQQGDMVKLTVIHESDRPESKLIGAVSDYNFQSEPRHRWESSKCLLGHADERLPKQMRADLASTFIRPGLIDGLRAGLKRRNSTSKRQRELFKCKRSDGAWKLIVGDPNGRE